MADNIKAMTTRMDERPWEIGRADMAASLVVVALAVADFSGGTCGATEEDQGNFGVWWHLVVTDGGGDLGGQRWHEECHSKLLDVGVNKQ